MQNFTIHHIGIAVRKMNEAIPIYKKLFNYDVTSGPFDDPIQKVSVCFLSRGEGDTVLELVAPIAADSPVHQILKKGLGTYHICYQVPDIRAAIDHLTGEGCMLLSDPVPAVAFDGREIAWLATPTNLLVELLQE
jgi:methylmalonyl-CoA/ethylmalonyl-CoA epimerase